MKRSKFSLSHYRLCSMNMGDLIPLTWYEALPGDSIQASTSALVRVSPLLAPVMHPVRIRIHHWFVPNRLLWDEWEDFITGGPDGTSTPEHPYQDASGNQVGTLSNYMGLPVGTFGQITKVSALPFRAYNLIYNEWYRDADLAAEAVVDTTSGLDASEWLVRRVAWEKDYFTTSRPWEQKGNEVLIPIGDSAPVVSDSSEVRFTFGTDVNKPFHQNATGQHTSQIPHTDSATHAIFGDQVGAFADLSQATGISVNELRLALAIQRYQEARAQYGSRYVEYLRYLGVRSSDARLQNPEFLGGGRQVIQFSEVLRTGNESGAATDPIGELKGHGIAAMRSNRFRRFFEEHGIVMSLMSVVPKAVYTSGLKRGFSRLNKEDYFQKELQFIGDQSVKVKEVNMMNTNPEDTFGYQQRYDEYRWLPSEVAGEFASTLNYWHYGREFSGDIALNQSFTDCTPTKRVNADTDSDCLYVMANHSIQARRMLQRQPMARTF